MANSFVPLPVPSGTGVGASVMINGLGPSKTLIVAGADFTGSLSLQISNDDVNFVDVVSDCTRPCLVAVPGRAQFARLRGRDVGGAPSVVLAAVDDMNVFALLPVPPGDTGEGASIDVAGIASPLTVIVTGDGGGSFRGSVAIQVSNDNANFEDAVVFGGPGVQQVAVTANFARVRTRSLQPVGTTGVVVTIVGNSSGPDCTAKSSSSAGPVFSTASITVPIPTNNDGDLLVMGVSVKARGAPDMGSIDTPAGWTLVRSEPAVFDSDTVETQVCVFRRVASSEPANVTVTFTGMGSGSGTPNCNAAILCYANPAGIPIIDDEFGRALTGLAAFSSGMATATIGAVTPALNNVAAVFCGVSIGEIFDIELTGLSIDSFTPSPQFAVCEDTTPGNKAGIIAMDYLSDGSSIGPLGFRVDGTNGTSSGAADVDLISLAIYVEVDIA